MIIENYITYPGEHCFFANIGNILSFKKTGLDESKLVIFGDGLNCEYINKNINGETYMFLGVSNNHIVNTAFSKLNISYDLVTNNCKEVAWEFTKNYLDDQTPLIIMVDTKYLKYSKIFDGSISRDHYIVLYGIDRNNAYVSDPFVLTRPKSYYHGATSLESINLARSSKAYECILLNTENIFQIGRIYILQQFSNTVKNNLNIFESNKMMGLSGMRMFSEDILMLKDLFKDKYTTEVTNLAFYLRVSGLLSRFIYIKNLMMDKRVFFYDKNSIEISIGLDNLYSQWNKVILLLLKCGIKYSDDQVRRLKVKIYDLTDMEEELMFKIISEINENL